MKVSKAAVSAGAAALLLAAVGGAALLYADPDRNDKAGSADPAATIALETFAAGSLERLETPDRLVDAPAYVFSSPAGEATTLSDFRGKVVVVNLWAMWCAPCRNEMPTLARLAQSYADTDLLVLPINVDATPRGRAEAAEFLTLNEPLAFYSDPRFQLPFELPGKGAMPQTVLLDRQGRIRAHLSGEADWAGAEARALVDALLEEGVGI
jgi:thiol-disulfide isomerase/thioredoxin